ncbi:reticulon-like protein B9 [Chenopodium quinoa]|uniref:reticulon-like protein B9 n=1 Tax=Chenopodium quinoa TaxID=63459 RepID=UPI000B781045|nr:reticulon-like protein B9 [Chenopodium quinoa]
MTSVQESIYNNKEAAPTRLFGRLRSIHEALGGGEVADILLWRKPKVSAILLLGITIIWLLFAVIEYSFVSLVCHISITTLLVFFIWCTLAELFNWKTPEIPEIMIQDSTFKNVATMIHARINLCLSMLLDIACRENIMYFFMTIGCLLMLSILGNYISSINLLFTSYICMQLLPFLYEKFEDEVNYIIGEIYGEMMKWYKMFDESILGKNSKRSKL